MPDVPHSDTESEVSGTEGDGSDEDDYDTHTDAGSVSGRSDFSLSHPILSEGGLMADKEFRSEVAQSLERAFAEGHSVDNAAVELKTLRMASNVPLVRVKEAVISGIVDQIPLVEDGGAVQRKGVTDTIARWGQLINKIGGIDPVETISLLQVSVDIQRCVSHPKLTCQFRDIVRLHHECRSLDRFWPLYTKWILWRKMTFEHGMYFRRLRDLTCSQAS